MNLWPLIRFVGEDAAILPDEEGRLVDILRFGGRSGVIVTVRVNRSWWLRGGGGLLLK